MGLLGVFWLPRCVVFKYANSFTHPIVVEYLVYGRYCSKSWLCSSEQYVVRSCVTVGGSNIVIMCMQNNIFLNMDFFSTFQVRFTRPIRYRGLLTFLEGWFPVKLLEKYAYTCGTDSNKTTQSYEFKSFSLSSVSPFYSLLHQALLT